MLSDHQIDAVLHLAFAEDIPFGDLTTEAFLPDDARARAELRARQSGVFSGGQVFARAMRTLDSEVDVALHHDDGARFTDQEVLATVSGPASTVLSAERTALNLVQRMTGIATLTAQYVTAVEGTNARITDTRKTTPGLRALERHAVRCGGGHNHRFCLSDAVMVKDNHLAVVTAEGTSLAEAVRAARRRLPHTVHIEVEVDRLDQISQALEGGAETIMLDNFSPADLRAGVALIGGRSVVEASGGVSLETVADIAATGVDVISLGALTHGVPAVDLGLDVQVN